MLEYGFLRSQTRIDCYIHSHSTIFLSINDKFRLSWHQKKMDSASWHTQAFSYTVFPFILAVWTPTSSPPATTKWKILTNILFFTSKLKEEEKDDLNWRRVFSLVSVHDSFLPSLRSPYLVSGSSYFCTEGVGHCLESWHLDLTLCCYILVFSTPWPLPGFSLTCSTYSLLLANVSS